MNKYTILNYITLTSCCLLLASTHALADRPAMDESSETFEAEIIDISTDLEDTPVFEEMPAQEATPQMEEISSAEEPTTLEALPELEEVSAAEVDAQQEQPADEVEPVIHVYDHRTETEITGDVVELQAGDTLPVSVMDFPRRGMTMEKVKNELGQPHEVSDAIGTPPITTWIYNDRVVYFEYSSVVHVVATH